MARILALEGRHYWRLRNGACLGALEILGSADRPACRKELGDGYGAGDRDRDDDWHFRLVIPAKTGIQNYRVVPSRE